MLKPDLTLTEASLIAGNPPQFLSWEITKGDEFNRIFKEICDLLREIFEKKLATATQGILGGDLVFILTKEAQTAKEKYISLLGGLKSLFDGRFAELKAKWSEILGNNLRHHHDRFNSTVWEFILNALEHGSDFCEAGSIVVEARIAADAILCVITQPKELPDLKPICEMVGTGADLRLVSHLLHSNETGRPRGTGMFNVAIDFYPMVGFENLPSSGGRAIILEMRQRILDMEEEMRRGYNEKNI